MTLEALREKIGDDTFFGLLRDWATLNRYGNVTTARVHRPRRATSGMDLKHFFDVWHQPANFCLVRRDQSSGST